MKKRLAKLFSLLILLSSFLLSSYDTAPALIPAKKAKYTIYVRMDIVGTSIYTTNGPGGCPFTEEYSSVTLKFFSDDAGTIPLSVSNLPVSIHHFYNFNTWVTNSDFTLTCNGTSVVVDNDMLSFYDDGCEGNYSAESYYINSGAGYTIIN
ncbi:MAG: hypothetical protein QM731_23590 [Chitinophagaceae bacterium]